MSLVLKTILYVVIYLFVVHILFRFLIKQYRKRKKSYDTKNKPEENVLDITIQLNFVSYLGFSFFGITFIFLVAISKLHNLYLFLPLTT